MISIVIPTYEQRGQGAFMLSQLLQSIARQKFNGVYEVVITDNSTDGSILKVCGQYPQVPLTYYHNPVRGASENINHGISLAKYDKVKLMMQDDLLTDPTALQKFSDALEVAGWVVSDSHRIDALGNRTGRTKVRYDPYNFDNNTVGMPSVVAFRKCNTYFDARLKTFCDLYFYYQLYQVYGSPLILAEPLVSQRYHNASLSRNQAPSHFKDKLYLLQQGLIPGKAPRIVVAVVFYKRWDNVSRWLKCWSQAETLGARLVFIHNLDDQQSAADFYFRYPKTFTQYDNIHYIPRNNQGADIGAFQDVVKGRLPGFPEYDYLLWATDDTIPMQPDFITPFLAGFDKRTGCTCMQISNEYTRHVRTTGFCLPREVATKLVWPTDPVLTVKDCWFFEHRGGPYTLLKQVEGMGKQCKQIAPLEKSPLYDMGFWYRNPEAKKVAHKFDRMNEHNKVFNNLALSQGPTTGALT